MVAVRVRLDVPEILTVWRFGEDVDDAGEEAGEISASGESERPETEEVDDGEGPCPWLFG